MALAMSQGIDFSFQTFDGDSIQFQGNASVSTDSIQLTKANQDQHLVGSEGWATYCEPMCLWDKAIGNVVDFTTHFTFVINSLAESNFVDGLAFFLVPKGSQLPVDSLGGALVLVDRGRNPSNSSTWFVAVEFDTFHNTNTTVAMDLNCSKIAHVDIDLNNLNSTECSYVSWFKDKIMSGGWIDATIRYNSSTQNFSVLMLDGDALGTDLIPPLSTTKYLPEWVTFGFSATTGLYFELHTLKAWEFNSNVQVKGGEQSELWLWFVLGCGSFILCTLVLAFIWFCHRSNRKKTYISGEEDDPAIEKEFEQVLRPKKFSYMELVAATDNFAINRLLGEEGFGRVYKGYLTSMNTNVTIKKINPGSRQGMKEFATEVKTISRLRHRNLIELIGWCHEKKELLLIYEFMSNGSLDYHLFKERTFLPWEKRYKIAQGIASALLYLHEEWEQCVMYWDIKSSNIMLDYNFNAKLGDFGLARLVDHAKELQTTLLSGTRDYLAPECFYNGKASKELDVYSFGVILLEIACGRKVFKQMVEEDQVQLVDWVWELCEMGRLLDAIDSKVIDFNEKQLDCLMVVRLWCTHLDCTAHPSMKEVLNVLNFNALPPILPTKLRVPTYPVPLSTFARASLVWSHATSTGGAEMSK